MLVALYPLHTCPPDVQTRRVTRSDKGYRRDKLRVEAPHLLIVRQYLTHASIERGKREASEEKLLKGHCRKIYSLLV